MIPWYRHRHHGSATEELLEIRDHPVDPGPGNFMMRAVVNGSGGPLMLGDQSGAPITASAVPGLIYQYAPATVTGYEGNPKVYPEMGLGPDNL